MRIALMAVLVAVSTPAFAAADPKAATTVDANAAQVASQPVKTQDAEEKKICRRIDASESRLGAKRLCLTEEQWKQRDAESSSL